MNAPGPAATAPVPPAVSTVRVDVSSVAPAGVRTLAADVFAPPPGVAPRPEVLWCLPGGGMTRRYFDIDVPGAGGSYSMARHLAAAGWTVVTLDHPGVGESDRPDDGWALTPDAVADVDAAAVAALRGPLGLGPDRPSIGVGHSMGGLLTCYVQARHRLHDALVLLGFGGGGLPSELTAAELALADDPEGVRREIAKLAAARFGTPLSPPPPRGSSRVVINQALPEPVRDGLADTRTELLVLCGLTSMIPGASTPELTAIDVPLFCGVGEHDIARPAHDIPAAFPASGDITLYVLPGAGHSHNAEPNRHQLWDRLVAWLCSRLRP